MQGLEWSRGIARPNGLRRKLTQLHFLGMDLNIVLSLLTGGGIFRTTGALSVVTTSMITFASQSGSVSIYSRDAEP